MSFCSNLFGDGKGALQQRFEIGRDRAGVTRDRVSLFDLTKNLGFADDHAVERTGDAEEMPDRFAFAKLVEVWLDVVGRNGEVLVKEAEKVGFGLRLRGLCVVLKREKLDPVAGGEDEAFADSGLVEEAEGGVGEALGGDSEALAHLDRRGVVVDSEKDETPLCRCAHGAANLWTAENWFATHTVSTTRKTKLER